MEPTFKDGFWHVFRITGPKHNLLRLGLAEEPAPLKVVLLPKPPEPDVLVEAEVIEQVLLGVADVNAALGGSLHVTEIHYLPADSEPASVYRLLAQVIADAALERINAKMNPISVEPTTLELSRFAKARIWWQGAPEFARMHGESTLLHEGRGGPDLASPREVAVEWLVPTGPRSLYGLLGARLEPSPGSFKIESIMEAPERPCLDSLASRVSESPFVGMLPEYAAAAAPVLAGILEDLSRRSGIAVVIHAAVVGDVGSSPVFFANLARVVGALLLKSESPRHEELLDLLKFRT